MDEPFFKASDIIFIENEIATSQLTSIVYDLCDCGAISSEVLQSCLRSEETQRSKARDIVCHLAKLKKSQGDVVEKIAQIFLNNDLGNVAQRISPELFSIFSTNGSSTRNSNQRFFREEILPIPHLPSSASLPSLTVVPHSPPLPETSISYHEGLADKRVEINVIPSRLIFGGPAHDDIYKNESLPRGYVLIVNVEKFHGNVHKERKGSMVDVENLSSLFTQMGYEIEECHNPTRERLWKVMDEFGNKEEWKNADSCVIVVMSHGANDRSVITADNYAIHIRKFFERFNNIECPALRGKPKIFIFQFCRGSQPDFGVEMCPQHVANDRRNVVVETDGGTFGETIPITKSPSFSDMLTIYPTVEGYVAYLNPVTGSWLINSICLEFMEHAHNNSISELLHKVSRRVKSQYSDRGRKQVPAWEYLGFDKHFYFNPPQWDSSNLNMTDLRDALTNGDTLIMPPHRLRHSKLESVSRSSTPEPLLTNFELQQSGSASWLRRRHCSGASTGSRELDEAMSPQSVKPRETGMKEEKYKFVFENKDRIEGKNADVVDTIHGNELPPRNFLGTKEDFQMWRRSYQPEGSNDVVASRLKRQLSAPNDSEAMRNLHSIRNYLQVNDSDNYSSLLDPIKEVILKNKSKFKKKKRDIESSEF